jgi:hypothetical protein
MPFFTNRGIIPLPVGGGGGGGYPETVYGTALVWYGLRPYNAAMIGQPAIQLSNGSTTKDIVFLSNGSLDVSDATFFTSGPPTASAGEPTPGPYTITKIYDQVGSVDVDTIGMGAYYLVMDSGLPSLAPGTAMYMTSTASITTTAQPFTASWVGYGSGTAVQTIKTNTSANYFGFNNADAANVASAVSIGFYTIDGAAADDIFHACQCFANGADDTNSIINVDGAETNGYFAATGDLSGIIVIGGGPGHRWREAGLWAGSKYSSFSAMVAQQTGFWTDI